MAFIDGYMTPREIKIWDLRRKNNSQSQISRVLGVSRQAIHKTYGIIDSKVEQAFLEVAATNHLIAKTINLIDGVMEAHSPAHQISVIVSFSNINGIKTWYLYEGNCQVCNLNTSCRTTLEAEADERGIELSPLDLLLSPTKLAIKIFGRYTEEKTDE